MKLPQLPKPEKPAPRVEGVEPRDEIYVRHPKLGVMPVRVVSHGKDGMRVRCGQKQEHTLGWDSYLGHRRRLLQTFEVEDQGADGAILKDKRGQRRYFEGLAIPEPPPNPKGGPVEPPPDDPLLGGLKLLTKAEPMIFPDGAMLFLKGGQIANRPGLTLKPVMDREGHQTKRWAKTSPDQKKGRQPAQQEQDPNAPLFRHGDTVKFRHGDVGGEGKIVGSGRDGVTVQDSEGNHHQVRHDAVVKEPAKPEYAPRNAGESDKQYAKRVVDTTEAPRFLPEDHGRYFNEGGKQIPLDQLVSNKSAEENTQGGDNGPKRMLAAYHGALGKRDPIKVKKRPDGKYDVTDGNGTLTSAQNLGWSSLPATEEGEQGAGEAAPAPSASTAGNVEPLFPEAEVKSLPGVAEQPATFNTEESLYQGAPDALEHLREWLNKGKGVANQMGCETMSGSPEQADFSKPGGMLFIAPLKGKPRAAEKVQADYAGDWGKLVDVVRCSLAFDTHDEIKGAIAKLTASGMKLARKPKDRFIKPVGSGYRDLLLNVTLPNGMVGEVQIHVKPMIQAKNEGHKHYELERSLNAKDKLTPDEEAQLIQCIEEQTRIYSAAWAKATGGQPEGQQMAKSLMDTAMNAWQFFEHDGAYFRRNTGKGARRAVDDVLVDKEWKPYQGRDKLAPAVFGDEVSDPMGGGSGGGGDGGGGDMNKSRVLFFKAQMKGVTGMGDLFAVPVTVAGHARGGKAVAPYTAIRHKAPETPPAPPGHKLTDYQIKVLRQATLEGSTVLLPNDPTFRILSDAGLVVPVGQGRVAATEKGQAALHRAVAERNDKAHDAAALAPRATRPAPDNRLIPVEGDEVYQTVPGAFGTAAAIYGKVFKSRTGLRVRTTGSAAMIGSAQAGRTYALDPAWTVKNDPEIARRREAREQAERDRKAAYEAEQAAESARLDALAVERGTLNPVLIDPGDVLESPDGTKYVVGEIGRHDGESAPTLYATTLDELDNAPGSIGSDLRGWRKLDEKAPDGAMIHMPRSALGDRKKRIDGQWVAVVWDDEANEYRPFGQAPAPKAAKPDWYDRPLMPGRIGTVTADGATFRLFGKHTAGRGYGGATFRWQVDQGPGTKRSPLAAAIDYGTGAGESLGTAVDYLRGSLPPDAAINILPDSAVPEPIALIAAPDPESKLRAMWTEQGVSKERQDRMIADVKSKAAPGAAVGPFTIGKPAAKDWRDESDWHARTQGRMKTLTDDQLRFIQQDAAEAARALDSTGGKSAGKYADEAHYAGMELAARAKAAPAPEPAHLADMKAKVKRGGLRDDIKALYERRLAANPAKWKPGQGVSYQVYGGGRAGMQTNRGFRIVQVSAKDKMALLRSVADTGLTVTGGSNDRIEDDWHYLGDLKRDNKYSAP